MNERSKLQSPSRPELILFLACIAIAIAPLALRGTSCGQDFDFHLESWMEAARQWHQGVLYPHWIASANYQAGEPRFVFYPPLSWMLGAILGIFFPWTWTPILFVTICLLAMGAASYKMACEWMPPATATIAACFYIISPYIFFVIYERSACAELLAAAWLPLLVLYALRDKPSMPQLALIIAALWLTDAPAAVMGCYALAVIALIASVVQHRWALLTRAASAVALGLGLAAVYIIPAIYEQRWVEIDRAIMPGMRIQDSFLFEHTGMAYHDQVLRTASWIATFMLIATLFAAIGSFRARKSQLLLAPLIALSPLIAFMQFPVSKFLWNIAPKLRFLQFPWRWLLVLGLIFAIFAATALALGTLNSACKTLNALLVLAFAVVFCVHAWRHFWLFCDDEDNIHAQITTLYGNGFEGTDEYTPAPADNASIQQNLAPVRVVSTPDGDEADSSIEENPDWQPNESDLVPAIIQIRRWNVEHMTAEVQTEQPGYAVLRLMDYPAWRVRINGKPASRLSGASKTSPLQWRETRMPGRPVRDDGLLVVPISAGTSTIDVQYTTTPDMWAGRIVSLASFLIWGTLCFLPNPPRPAGGQ